MNDTAITGCLLGTCIGDAIGLPREGLSARRATRLFGEDPRFCLLPGRGMMSDDGEHACLVLEALTMPGARTSPEAFATALASRLRWWSLGIPLGAGKATLKACAKLWIATPPERSGVHSAGNGPAMRAPMLGTVLANHPRDVRLAFVRASTRITHTDPRAELGAAMLAEAAAWSATTCGAAEPTGLLHRLAEMNAQSDDEASRWLQLVGDSLTLPWDAKRLLASLGCPRGVTGYMYYTVPAALAAWLRDPRDFTGGIARVLSLGGDADSTAAIVGGLCGASVGTEGIPPDWHRRLLEYPRNIHYLKDLAGAAANLLPPPSRLSFTFLPVRNLVFAMIVLTHGFRRLFPPY